MRCGLVKGQFWCNKKGKESGQCGGCDVAKSAILKELGVRMVGDKLPDGYKWEKINGGHGLMLQRRTRQCAFVIDGGMSVIRD